MGNTLSLLAVLVIGSFAGVLSGMFGIGGGIVIVPALMLIVGFDQQKATGTSLGALLLPVGILAALKYWQKGDVDLRYSALLALGLLLGAQSGAVVNFTLSKLDPRIMQRSFAVFLVIVAVYVWFREPKQAKAATPARPAASVEQGHR